MPGTDPVRVAAARARVFPRMSRRRRRLSVTIVVVSVAAFGATALWRSGGDDPPLPKEIAGSPAWAAAHYGNPDSPGYEERNIVALDFLGSQVFVHEKATRHFLRLERLFEARAPEYAASVAVGELDDWGYANRAIRGKPARKSNHAFGIAIDVNALTNVLGTPGDMPMEVVSQWEAEGGDWGGDWSRPDPMHFETHLTPREIRRRYLPDGSPREWYLEELIRG